MFCPVNYPSCSCLRLVTVRAMSVSILPTFHSCRSREVRTTGVISRDISVVFVGWLAVFLWLIVIIFRYYHHSVDVFTSIAKDRETIKCNGLSFGNF